eukprot:TRINITY_DN24519_c0_g1_i2.p3 TRINITY_DN24519_c0_g1~~TRINITY_DN24519_c0_g1_i2.p3  ORF type:complete len:100 (+),score=19.38 TRINITY_DN24519_c0_g1_i2:72-371(+)
MLEACCAPCTAGSDDEIEESAAGTYGGAWVLREHRNGSISIDTLDGRPWASGKLVHGQGEVCLQGGTDAVSLRYHSGTLRWGDGTVWVKDGIDSETETS